MRRTKCKADTSGEMAAIFVPYCCETHENAPQVFCILSTKARLAHLPSKFWDVICACLWPLDGTSLGFPWKCRDCGKYNLPKTEFRSQIKFCFLVLGFENSELLSHYYMLCFVIAKSNTLKSRSLSLSV